MVFDIFKWGSIVLGIGLILTIYIFFNILGNGYYYATHGKYQNDNKNYPFVYWIANHELSKEYVPSYKVRIVWDAMSSNSYVSTENIYDRADSFAMNRYGGSYFLPEKKANGTYYDIDINAGKVIGEGVKEGKLDKDSRKEARRRAYTLLNDVRSEIRENSKPPKINLQ